MRHIALNPWGDPKPSRPSSPSPSKDSGSGKGNLIDDWIDYIKEKCQRESRTRSIRNGGSNQQPPSGGPSFSVQNIRFFVVLFCIVVIGAWLSSSFFLVQESEYAVVLRFGKMHRIVGSGLNWRFPYPFEQHITQKVAVVNKIENERGLEGNEHTLVLTGDENMIHIQYTVLWKIKDIKDFLFTAYHPENTIQVAAESSVREVIGQTTARLALTEDRDKIGVACQLLLQKILDSYRLGVQIISVQLQRVDPPAQVVKAFNDMQASRTDADRAQKEAEAYAYDILPRARGDAEQIRQKAQAHLSQVTSQAQAEAGQFEQMRTAYEASPDLALKSYQARVMQKMLKASKKTIVDGKIAQGILPHFPLKVHSKHGGGAQ